MYDLGIVGNCQVSALVSQGGSIDWLCMPRPDSPPVFGRLLDPEGGNFSISPKGNFKSEQEYVKNTNVLVTRFFCEDGTSFQVTDFCPRFEQHGRMFRPLNFFRIVEPLKRNPQIVVDCSPISGWEKTPVNPIRGNSHIKYEIRGDTLRLATNMPLTYLLEKTSFALAEKIYFGLTWGTAIEEDLPAVSNRFLDQTVRYWQSWVKHCSIPTLFQKETIRSALALKLHCYEDTGAILAALTTSLPEEKDHNRNWDYRFCWLRDAAFVLSAFRKLGHFEEMEGFIKFLIDIGRKHEGSIAGLRPVYSLDQSLPIPEFEHPNWKGFAGSKPVRSNNQAAEHVQNDVYGEMILALAPVFFDDRFHHLRTAEHETLFQNLTNLCIQNISKPDAGLWEFRDGWQEHSFSNLMCWAGIDRALRIKDLGFLKGLDREVLIQAKKAAESAIQASVQDKSLRNGPKDESFDASLLLLAVLRFPDEDLCKATTVQIQKHLHFPNSTEDNGYIYRYLRTDDFGKPKSAFLICSFWLIEALALLNPMDKPVKILSEIVKSGNSLGLFSEHYSPDEKLQLGNFPQAYSHVGMINAAFAVSTPWEEVL